MNDFHPYACRMCGATSYRSVIDRDGTGALRPTGLFHCSGCTVVFVDPKAWRDGEVELPAPPPSTAVRQMARVSLQSRTLIEAARKTATTLVR